MIISSQCRDTVVSNENSLLALLSTRDACAGGEFWMSDELRSYPCLALIFSGPWGNAFYFPEEGHPGFRCLKADSDPDLPSGAFTTFIWSGCDPASGEEVPNEFVLCSDQTIEVARVFYRDSARALPASFSWFEL